MLIASLAFDKIISSEMITQLNRVEEILGQIGDKQNLPLLQKYIYNAYGIPINRTISLRTLEEFTKATKSPYLEPFAAYAGIEKVKLVFEEVVLDEFRKEPEPGNLRKIGERHRQLVCNNLKKGLEKVFKDESAFIKELKTAKVLDSQCHTYPPYF